jgi:hypothetical protein
MEAISGCNGIQEIAVDHAIHPNQVSQWRRQLLNGASELITRGIRARIQTIKSGQIMCAAEIPLPLPYAHASCYLLMGFRPGICLGIVLQRSRENLQAYLGIDCIH